MWRATVIIVLSLQCTSLQFLLSTSYTKKNPIKKCFFLMVVEIHSFFKTSFLGVVSYTKISVKSMILVPVTDAKTSERTARGNAIAENKITNC